MIAHIVNSPFFLLCEDHQECRLKVSCVARPSFKLRPDCKLAKTFLFPWVKSCLLVVSIKTSKRSASFFSCKIDLPFQLVALDLILVFIKIVHFNIGILIPPSNCPRGYISYIKLIFSCSQIYQNLCKYLQPLKTPIDFPSQNPLWLHLWTEAGSPPHSFVEVQVGWGLRLH